MSAWIAPPSHPVLQEGDAHVWVAFLEDVAIERLVVTPEERERARAFRRDADARRFLAGRGIARAVLAGYAGVRPEALEFTRECGRCGDARHGKPRVVAPPEAAGLRFSVSHSGDVVACAVALGREVGVDVEEVVPGFDHATVSERFFTSGERAALAATPPGPERERRFLDMWTRKEAYLKLGGYGLAVPLEEVDHSDLPGAAFHPIELGPRHVGVLAVEGAPAKVAVIAWRSERTG